jgi:hypothetical protein
MPKKSQKRAMLTSALVFITLMPMLVSPSGNSTVPLSKPLAVAAFVDSAKILGLPKLRLRDSNGNPYLANKVMLQEPLATIHHDAGLVFPIEVNRRKAFIQSYVRGR